MAPCVIFDMDGTLVDSYPGILQSYRYAFGALGLPFPGEGFVRSALGKPLLSVFRVGCGLPGPEAREAVRLYREHYRRRGREMAPLYPGVWEMVGELRRKGYFLGIATLKQEDFARDILTRVGLLPCFAMVQGMDSQDSRTKGEMLRCCRKAAGALPGQTVLVGDSPEDGAAAREAGAAFVAAGYGYGCWTPESLQEAGALGLAGSPGEVPWQVEQCMRRKGRPVWDKS